MKPLTAGAGMNSTIQPSRKSPMPRTVNPCENVLEVWKGGRGPRSYRYESHSGGNLWAWPSVGMGSFHVLDDLSYGQGHNSHGPD